MWQQLFNWYNQSHFRSCIWFMTLSSSEHVADDRWILLNTFPAPLVCSPRRKWSLFWKSTHSQLRSDMKQPKRLSSELDWQFKENIRLWEGSWSHEIWHVQARIMLFSVQSEPLVFDSFSRIRLLSSLAWICACLFIQCRVQTVTCNSNKYCRSNNKKWDYRINMTLAKWRRCFFGFSTNTQHLQVTHLT